jgi:hypothetical protein
MQLHEAPRVATEYLTLQKSIISLDSYYYAITPSLPAYPPALFGHNRCSLPPVSPCSRGFDRGHRHCHRHNHPRCGCGHLGRLVFVVVVVASS